MRREKGFTILELMVTIAVIGGASLAVVTSANGIRQEDVASRAYCADVHGMRHAVRLLREDLRNAATVEELEWTFDGHRVSRGEREIVGNVREFEVTADGSRATARLVVGDGAEVAVRVRMRNAGRVR
jgi:prepilin-type N-terminal cleavage/methylation domain-containing protein